MVRGEKATLGLAAIALALGSCGLSAGDASRRSLRPARAASMRRSSSTTAKRARARPSSSSMASARAPIRGGSSPPSSPRATGSSPSTSRASASRTSRSTDAIRCYDQAELLAQLIEDKDLRDLTLVGHSFGGGIALLLALEANQRLDGRITRLVLLNSIAYPQNIPVFFRLLDVPLVSQIGVRMVPPSVQARVALQHRLFRRQQDRSAKRSSSMPRRSRPRPASMPSSTARGRSCRRTSPSCRSATRPSSCRR